MSPASRDALVAEAARCAPAEACGILLGRRWPDGSTDVARVQPTRNGAADPTRGFEIDPADLFAAVRSARAGVHPPMVGLYHSHPGGEAAPSDTDLARAWQPGLVWVIVGGDGRLGAWALTPAAAALTVDLLARGAQ